MAYHLKLCDWVANTCLQLWKEIGNNSMKPADIALYSLDNVTALSEKGGATLSAYYTNFLQNDREYYADSYNLVHREVSEILAKQPDLRILDIGSGCGTESIFFAHFSKYVKGIDVNQNRLNCARERLEKHFPDLVDNLKFQYKSILDIDEKEKFDLIWMNQAFHHMEPREEVVKKIGQIAADNCVVIFAECNALNPLIQLRLFKRRGFNTIADYVDELGVKRPYGNERVLSPSRLQRHMQAIKFRRLENNYFRVMPNNKKYQAIEAALHKTKLPPFCFTHYNSIFIPQ